MHNPPFPPPNSAPQDHAPSGTESGGNWWTRLSTKGKIGTGVGAFVALSVVLNATGLIDEDDAGARTPAAVVNEELRPDESENFASNAPETVVDDATLGSESDAPADEAEASALMPDVVGMDLQAAQDRIQEEGVFYSRSEDATGQDRMQILDRNWTVVSQDPQPGTPIGEGDALLYVVKDDEI